MEAGEREECRVGEDRRGRKIRGETQAIQNKEGRGVGGDLVLGREGC